MEHRPLMLETTRLLAARLLRHAAGGAMDDGPALVVVDGADRALRLPLMGGGGTIGRGARAALRLRDAEASRLHAVVRERDGWLEIDDLGSKNGVVLNGRRIDRPQRLRDGDRVRIGASTLEARGIGDAPPEPPVAGPAPDEDRGKGASVRAAAAILLAAAVALALAA